MAVIGRWRSGAKTNAPTTSWAAPSGLFDLEERNDTSAYSINNTTATLTLPSSDLADGYLLVVGFEYEDTSNGRHNPQGRLIQASGTGNFVGQASSGYNRDSSEDRSYVRCWGFVDNPSASSTYQFQWRRDSDAPTGGTVLSDFEVIPLFYSNHGIYSSTSTSCPGNTTVSQVTGFTAVDESDTTAIEIASNTVTLKGDNKRYLCLGGQYWQNIGAARTQRIHGFRVDGTTDTAALGYSYGRNSSNADIGEMFTTIVETVTTDRTIDQVVWRGDSVSPFPAFGADVAGNTTGSNPQHAMVILELNDDAEVFKSENASQQAINTAGTRVQLDIAATENIRDAGSFNLVGNEEFRATQAMDLLAGANVFGGYASTSTARYTGYATFTIDNVEQSYTTSGDYGRGNQGTQDTWGWSANLLSYLELSLSDDVGVRAGKITGGEGGTVAVLNGYAGFWGVNLDTMEAPGGGSFTIVSQDSTHSHNSENTTLTHTPPNFTVVSNDSTHSHNSENTTLSHTPPNFTVVSQDSSHVHNSENTVLSANSPIVSQDSTHTHNSENVTLTSDAPNYPIVSQDSSHAHSSENTTLSHTPPGFGINAQDSSHTHTSEQTTLTANSPISSQDASHTHNSENVVVSFTPATVTIVANDSSHAHTSENTQVTPNTPVTSNNSTHTHSSENTVLSFKQTVSPNNSSHAHTSENTSPTGSTLQIVAQNSVHVHTSENVVVLKTWNRQPEESTAYTDEPGAGGVWTEQSNSTDNWTNQPTASSVWTEQEDNSDTWDAA